MSDFTCDTSNETPTWGLIDLFVWKVLPERCGGGRQYIQRFKDAWVRQNKAHIMASANKYQLPPELLAGVCWIEVGGDPNFIDTVAVNVRSFDWSGPNWVDRNLTITHHPSRTSFGAVSIQLRTAAQTMGLDPSTMSYAQISALAKCLQRDVFNIEIVARHLNQLAHRDGIQGSLPALSMDQVRIIGARYNRGSGLSLEQIRQNTSYGNFIVNHWQRFTGLLR